MDDRLLPLPLTERSVHLCVDMQRIFWAEGPWPTPWMERVLPIAAALVSRHPENHLHSVHPARASRANAGQVAAARR
jgi:nicotinamidase-related amidase